jgi:hypothetical protein
VVFGSLISQELIRVTRDHGGRHRTLDLEASAARLGRPPLTVASMKLVSPRKRATKELVERWNEWIDPDFPGTQVDEPGEERQCRLQCRLRRLGRQTAFRFRRRNAP